jgi:hypothetical protein
VEQHEAGEGEHGDDADEVVVDVDRQQDRVLDDPEGHQFHGDGRGLEHDGAEDGPRSGLEAHLLQDGRAVVDNGVDTGDLDRWPLTEIRWEGRASSRTLRP